LPAADQLLPPSWDASIESGADNELDTIACLRNSCQVQVINEPSLAEHCANVHGMAEIEIMEGLRERAAREGGAFWIGGLNPSLDEDWWQLIMNDEDGNNGEERFKMGEDLFLV